MLELRAHKEGAAAALAAAEARICQLSAELAQLSAAVDAGAQPKPAEPNMVR